MISIVFWILALIVTITIHEAAHAWMADKLGDPTARIMGRLSLNPIVHYDPTGTTILLVTVILTFLGIMPFPFGWAKPVEFDPYNLKNPRRDSALISLAGPLINITLAIVLGLILRLTQGPFTPLYILPTILGPFIILNLSLGIFNLIPFHPLDGGKILVGILPQKEAILVDNFLNRYGMILLIVCIIPTFGGSSLISMIISPTISFLIKLLIP